MTAARPPLAPRDELHVRADLMGGNCAGSSPTS